MATSYLFWGQVNFSKVAFVGTVLFHVILLSLRFLILTDTLHRYWEHGPEPYLFKVMRPENEESNLAKVHLIPC